MGVSRWVALVLVATTWSGCATSAGCSREDGDEFIEFALREFRANTSEQMPLEQWALFAEPGRFGIEVRTLGGRPSTPSVGSVLADDLLRQAVRRTLRTDNPMRAMVEIGWIRGAPADVCGLLYEDCEGRVEYRTYRVSRESDGTRTLELLHSEPRDPWLFTDGSREWRPFDSGF